MLNQRFSGDINNNTDMLHINFLYLNSLPPVSIKFEKKKFAKYTNPINTSNYFIQSSVICQLFLFFLIGFENKCTLNLLPQKMALSLLTLHYPIITL